MSIEKQVKNQARAAMKGNISKLIAAAGFVLAVFLLFEYIGALVLGINGMIDLDSETSFNTKDGLLVVLVEVAVVAALLLFSPLLNGFLRMAANTAVQKDCSSTDVLYFFRRRRYAKTIIINMLLLMIFILTSTLLDVSQYCSVFFPQLSDVKITLNLYTISQQDFSIHINMLAAILVNVVSFIIKLLVYMLFVHYPLMAYALDDSIGIGKCVFVTMGFSFAHFKELFKLMLSFIGWFALCFFVVSAIYVLPYFAVASAMSARWLFNLKKAEV